MQQLVQDTQLLKGCAGSDVHGHFVLLCLSPLKIENMPGQTDQVMGRTTGGVMKMLSSFSSRVST